MTKQEKLEEEKSCLTGLSQNLAFPPRTIATHAVKATVIGVKNAKSVGTAPDVTVITAKIAVKVTVTGAMTATVVLIATATLAPVHIAATAAETTVTGATTASNVPAVKVNAGASAQVVVRATPTGATTASNVVTVTIRSAAKRLPNLGEIRKRGEEKGRRDQATVSLPINPLHTICGLPFSPFPTRKEES